MSRTEEQDKVNTICGLVNLTVRCNQDCIFCCDGDVKESGHDLTTDEAKGKILALRSEGADSVTIIGGEPLVRKDIVELVEYARGLGLSVGITSNGTPLTKKLLDGLTRAGLTSIEISMHAVDPQLSRTISQRSFTPERQVRALTLLGELGSDGPGVSINFVMFTANYSELPAFVEHVADEYPFIEELFINFVDPIGYPAMDNSLVPTYAAVKDSVQNGLEIAERRGLSFTVDSIPGCILGPYFLYLRATKEMLRGVRYAKDTFRIEDVAPNDDQSQYYRVDACFDCPVSALCPGVNFRYLSIHGDAGIEPLEPSILSESRFVVHAELSSVDPAVFGDARASGEALSRQRRYRPEPDPQPARPAQAEFAVWTEHRTNNRYPVSDEELGPSAPPPGKELVAFLQHQAPGRAWFVGGEPTLRKDLGRLIRAAVTIGHEAVLVSNGRRFAYDKYARSIVDAGTHRFVVYLHSADAAVHNRLAGDDAFEQTVQGIRNLRRFGANVIVHCVVTGENIDGLEKLVDFCRDQRLGLHLAPVGTDVPRGDELAVPVAQCARRVEEALVYARTSGLDDSRLSFSLLPCCCTAGLKGLEREALRRLPGYPAVETPATPLPAPCLGCELLDACSVAAPGVIALHGAAGLQAPGQLYVADLEMEKKDALPRFDVEACAAGEQPPGPGPLSALVDRGAVDLELWETASAAEEVEALAAKNAHGFVLEAGEKAPVTHYLHPACKGCLKLHRCAGVFSSGFGWEDETVGYASTWSKRRQEFRGALVGGEPDFAQGYVGRCQASPPSAVARPSVIAPATSPGGEETSSATTRSDPSDGSTGMGLSRVEHVDSWLVARLSTMAPGQRETISGRYPVVWLGAAPQAELEPPVVPWRLVDLLKGKGARMHSYDIAAALNQGGWSLTYEKTPDVPPEWYYERLGTAFILSTCPASCVMCSVRKLYADRMTPLPTVYRILEEFRLCGYTRVDYFGGEPTVRDDLAEIIYYATTLDCYSDIITNGIPLTSEVAAKIAKAGLSLCMVSLDAPDPEAHDTIRGVPGGYDMALSGLNAILEQPGVEVNIDTVILAQNYKIMHRQAELAAKIGATHVNFFFCVCGPIAAPKPMWLTAEQLTEFHSEVLPKIRETVERCGITFTLSPDLPEDPDDIKRISSGVYNPFFDEPDLCAGPDDEVYITLEGDVYPCTSPTILETEHVVGNIFEKSLIEILRDQPMDEFRQVAGHVDACRMCFRCHIEPRIETRFEDARLQLKDRLRDEWKKQS